MPEKKLRKALRKAMGQAPFDISPINIVQAFHYQRLHISVYFDIAIGRATITANHLRDNHELRGDVSKAGAASPRLR